MTFSLRLLAECIAGCLLALWLSGKVHADELPLAVQIVACESAGRENVWGDNHKSFGIAQFQRVTFKTFKRRAGMADADWRNSYDQLMLLQWALAHNHGWHWTCFRKIKRGTWHMSRELELRMRRSLLINEMNWRE